VDGSKYTGTKTRTFTIAHKQVTPVLDYYSDAGTTKVYDGTTVVTDTSKLGFLKTNSGILSSEADDVEFTANYAFTDPNAGSAKEIIATDITLTGAKAGNYKLTTDKGINQALASNMIDDLVSDEKEIEKCIDMANKYIKKKRIAEKKDLQKVGAYLYTKGFEWNIISIALSTCSLYNICVPDDDE